jgi:predicted Mrr-cat superfamily restriction endonuclease
MSEQRGAWVIRAGAGGNNYGEDFQQAGVVAVGFRPVGDLTGMSRDEIRGVVEQRWSDKPQGTRRAYTYQLDAFANEIRPGDIVLTPLGPGTRQVLSA